MFDSDKGAIRKSALATRDKIRNRSMKSACIRARLQAHPDFQSATSVLIYINIRSEVETRQLIDHLLKSQSKKVFIPYCDGDELGIFPLQSWSQLEKQSFGLLEPKKDLVPRGEHIPEYQIDLTIVPGVAFDGSLNRLGYGKGYYDKLLARTLPETNRLAIAFHDQIRESVPTDERDVPMHEILTEKGFVVDRSAIKTALPDLA